LGKLGLGLAVAGGSAVVLGLAAPALLEPNHTITPGPYAVSPRARALHERLFVADLHADSLLWSRDLLARGSRGHVDVPRLIEGGVALQAFTVVTKAPRGLNIERNDDRTDQITLLAMAQLWPPRTWGSLKERALHQARRFDRAVGDSRGRLVPIRAAADLRAYRARRREGGITAGFLGLEGAHVLEGDAANLDALFAAGFRMMSPAHFFDTEVGGSAHGTGKGGLTALGREVIRRMEQKKMIVDLAHASDRTVDDVLSMATRPVVVSHAGVRGTCDNRRNLSDAQLRGIAGSGGVVGIGYWPTAICGRDARAIARAIRHAVAVAGIEHVGLGSDFDGAVTTPFDTTGLPLVTEALLAEGFAEDEVARIMGGNVLGLLEQALP
jgi:microsomal dipeptidase-like Zn-dependent dipeptidase